MKDLKNMFNVFVKGEFSEEIEPMTRLTRGLMYVYDMPYKASQIYFVQIDSHRTGLTSDELKQCLVWREAYFDFHRYTSETVYEQNYTKEELQEIRKERNKAFKIMSEIEKELGEPQGRFAI
jgi:hypothetical protein